MKLNIPLQNNEGKSIDSILVDSEIHPFMELPQSQEILTVDNKLFGTRGNFSCIVGPKKSRKTYLTALMEAICLDESLSHGFFKSYIENTTILHFDLEQSKYHVQKHSKRVYSLTGNKAQMNNYRVFSLRENTIQERIFVIEMAINLIPNISLVVIDGIADLVTSVNDECQCDEIIQKLMRWSSLKNIHILTVIHDTKTNRDPKGHLGSLIGQKAETVLAVKNDSKRNITTVSSYCSRNLEIPEFNFSVDPKDCPYLFS